MARAQELPHPPVPRLGDLCRFVALLGASVVVFYVVGEPKPSVSVSVRAGSALAGFLIWLVGATLVLLHVQGSQDQNPRFFFSGPGAQEQERRRPIPRFVVSGPEAQEFPRPPVPRHGDLCRFVALLGASVVVFYVVGEPKPSVSVSVRAGCALAGFLLWLVGAALVLLHIQAPQNLKPRFVVSGPGAPA